MNIEDARFLFSALIQALPTIISLSLIAVFALKIERGFFKRFYKHIIFIILLFYIAILGDIVILNNLQNFIENNSFSPYIFLGISCFAIIYLIYFLFLYIHEVNYSLKNHDKPKEKVLIKILEYRYAIGEINKDQFEQMKEDLS